MSDEKQPLSDPESVIEYVNSFFLNNPEFEVRYTADKPIGKAKDFRFDVMRNQYCIINHRNTFVVYLSLGTWNLLNHPDDYLQSIVIDIDVNGRLTVFKRLNGERLKTQ